MQRRVSFKEELVAAVEDVRKQGDLMKTAAGEFADDPCSSVKRGNMVRAARALLSAVTRLLIWLTWQMSTNYLFS